MKVFISGGCKNGKSTYALKMAVAMTEPGHQKPLYYIATMRPGDEEDLERIRRHRDHRRGMGFITVEQDRDIIQILNRCDKAGTFLLDSTTALLANEMFLQNGEIREDAGMKTSGEMKTLISRIDRIVIVSDYIYSDVVFYDETTKKYCRALADVDRVCAKYCDVVLETAYGNLSIHKGGESVGTDFWRSISGEA